MLDLDNTAVQSSFSLKPSMLRDILRYARPLGHHEDSETLNLGFGFLYYGLVRSLRPRHVLVIGSGFGFSVTCLGLGLKDNGAGQLTFVDPSFSVLKHGLLQTVGGTSQWDDPKQVKARYARFGLEEIVTHHKLSSADFFHRYDLLTLEPIDLAFIDGNHAYEHVRCDFIDVLRNARKNSYILLHDSNIYLREMVRHAGVKRWLKKVSQHKELFELVDFPFSSGVALVRVLRRNAWKYID
jgi:predicted O-methyltransferase YrrM